jgi:hypothetical protein
MVGLLLDFDADQQILRNARGKIRHFGDVSMLRMRYVAIGHMSIRFYSRVKVHGDRSIRGRLAAICGPETSTAEAVKRLVCESYDDEIDSAYFSDTDTPHVDIAKAVSKVLNEKRSISRHNIAAFCELC